MSAMPDYRIVDTGGSRSFPAGDVFLAGASAASDCMVVIGAGAARAYATLAEQGAKLVLIELGHECLGDATGEKAGGEGGPVLGFSRFRMGTDAPTKLIELVKQPRTDAATLAQATALFEHHGFKVAVCNDRPGRIVDRLIRPYFNAALERLDDGLAEAADLDRALKLGLGYARGPIEWLESSGLAEHYDVSRALHEALADPVYQPSRRAQVAARRKAAR